MKSNNPIPIKFIITLLLFYLLTPLVFLHAADVANLRCEYLNNPLGIAVAKPREAKVRVNGEVKTVNAQILKY